MRIILLAVALSAVALFGLGCGGGDDDAGDGGRLRVVATIAPTGSLVRQVGGDLIELRVLVGSGVDPHDYEVKSDDRKAIDRAKVIFRNGAGIDEFLDKATSGKKDRVTTLTDGLTLRETGDEHEGEDKGDEHEHSEDPHAWHDPENDKLMIDAIVAALAKADAANAEAYRRNGDAAKARFDAVDREIKALIAGIPAENRKMVTNHDAFGYFIERYGLTFVGAVIPSLTTQAEPSAKDIAELVETIKRERVKAIFAESSIDPKVAEQIAKDTGAKVVDDLYGDSLGEPGSGAETVDGMLLANARKIAEALK